MPTYSIAQAKDQLSKLVDEVLDGKDVTITRHGKPVAELRPAAARPAPKSTTPELLERLRQFRESLPKSNVDSVAEIRAMRDDV